MCPSLSLSPASAGSSVYPTLSHVPPLSLCEAKWHGTRHLFFFFWNKVCMIKAEENNGACSVLFRIGIPASAENQENSGSFREGAVAEEPAQGSLKDPLRITRPAGEERDLLLVSFSWGFMTCRRKAPKPFFFLIFIFRRALN